VWFNGTTMAATVEDNLAAACFAVAGTNCPDTTWTFSTLWTGAYAPTIIEFAPGAWAVYANDPGILEIDGTAVCGGVTFVAPPIFLTVASAYYAPTLCVAPTEYTNILDLIAASCVGVLYSGAGVGSITPSSSDWFYFPVPWYQNIGGTVGGALGTTITFPGLRSFFGTSDMMVKVTITDGFLTAGAYPFYCDNKNDTDDFPLTPGATWEYTIPNGDIDTWVTGFGSGDGAGDSAGGDYFQFHIEVKIA
jgi:hypothetical protein